jgi:hypothetical protein
MNDDSVTGSSGSSYISSGSYQYILDIPDPPKIFIEWSPEVPRPGILLRRKNKDSTIPSFSDKTDSDTTVSTIQREDILDTVSKPIQSTYYKRWKNTGEQLLLPGEVFKNQGFLYAKHIHHPKAYGVLTVPSNGSVIRGRYFPCNKLLIIKALRYKPENIWIDKPSQPYREDLERYRKHCYNCYDVYGPKGRNFYRPGYNCKTIIPFKKHSNVVNHRVGNIQFGDLTFIESSYTDLGKEQEKKIAPAFTTSQNQAYAFYTWSPTIQGRNIISSRQSVDYLDNHHLIGLEFNTIYKRSISRTRSLQKRRKFAKCKPDIVPFPEHPFDIKYDYPQIIRIYPKTKILKINGFSVGVGDWTETPYCMRTAEERQEALNYLYKTLYSQWLPLQHYKHNVGHIRLPTIIHDKPKSIRDQEKATRKEIRRQRRFLRKAHKAQVSWLVKQPKWIKNRRFSF